MSCVLVHFDPVEQKHYDAWTRDSRRAVPFESPKKQLPRNHQHENKSLIHRFAAERRRQEALDRLRAQREAKSENELRERVASSVKSHNASGLSCHLACLAHQNDSKAVSDHLNKSGVVPPYISERRQRLDLERSDTWTRKEVERAEKEFPPGTTPLPPHRIARTREYFTQRVEELTARIQKYRFLSAGAQHGKERLRAWEHELREAEGVLQLYQFPVVFSQMSNPVAVERSCLCVLPSKAQRVHGHWAETPSSLNRRVGLGAVCRCVSEKRPWVSYKAPPSARTQSIQPIVRHRHYATPKPVV